MEAVTRLQELHSKVQELVEGLITATHLGAESLCTSFSDLSSRHTPQTPRRGPPEPTTARARKPESIPIHPHVPHESSHAGDSRRATGAAKREAWWELALSSSASAFPLDRLPLHSPPSTRAKSPKCPQVRLGSNEGAPGLPHNGMWLPLPGTVCQP